MTYIIEQESLSTCLVWITMLLYFYGIYAGLRWFFRKLKEANERNGQMQ
jgi:hypothetical protein